MAPVLLLLSELSIAPVGVGCEVELDRATDEVEERVPVLVLLTAVIVITGLGVASGLPIPKGCQQNLNHGKRRGTGLTADGHCQSIVVRLVRETLSRGYTVSGIATRSILA